MMRIERRRDYWPTNGWEESSPLAQGMDPDRLSQLQVYGDTGTPSIHGIVVLRHGYIVWERYHHGFHRGSYHSINSVTKSVVSALVGIALRERLIADLDQPLVEFFPDDAGLLDDPGKQAITVRHLLSMTSGLPRVPIEEFPRHSHLVEAALARPLAHLPGTVFQYDDASAHLVSALLSRVTDMSTAAFAERTLFQPLGIEVTGAAHAVREGLHGPHTSHPFGLWGDDPAGHAWMVDRQGLQIGGFGLHLTLRDMAKFGYLYLNHGRWEQTIIIPPDYLQSSTQPQSAEAPYGYFWWTPRHKLDPSAFFASGYGGQYIDVLPALDVVIAIACSLDQGHVETHGRMVSRLVAASILEGC